MKTRDIYAEGTNTTYVLLKLHRECRTRTFLSVFSIADRYFTIEDRQQKRRCEKGKGKKEWA